MANWLFVSSTGGYYRTVLQAACHDGPLELVKLLLEHGADPNLQGKLINCCGFVETLE